PKFFCSRRRAIVLAAVPRDLTPSLFPYTTLFRSDPTKNPAGSDDTSPGGDGTGGSDPVGDADSSGRNDQWTGDATAGDGVHELSRTGANPPLALALVLLTAGAVLLVLRRRAQRARRTH